MLPLKAFDSKFLGFVIEEVSDPDFAEGTLSQGPLEAVGVLNLVLANVGKLHSRD